MTVRTDIPADVAGERASVVAQLRGGAGAPDALVNQALTLLLKSWPADVAAMAADELLCEVLQAFPIGPAWFEHRMTALRRRLLFSPAMPGAATLLQALAIQCHLNEYAWAETPEEAECVAGLLEGRGEATPEQVMAIGCYRPLADAPQADAWLTRGWSGPVRAVLQEQVVDVREELEIAAALPSLSPIRDGVSGAVRAQYEANPYPRWRRASMLPRVRELAGAVAPVSPRYFVAGCGTGRQAIEGAHWLGAGEALAVDLSRRSLAYAVRKSREAGLGGITYAQADLLELPRSLDGRFDVVSCVGVLHHMADPFEGLAAVARTVRPGGLLNLGLYSRAARAVLDAPKALAAGYRADQVRELRQAILARPADDPVQAVAQSRDFYATSGCRDLIMHVQEHQHTIDDLKRMMRENNLTFRGFSGLPPGAFEAYRAMFPHDPQGLDLDSWAAFEAERPATFGRMYQFWTLTAD